MLFGYTRHISILAAAAALGLAGGTALAAPSPESHGVAINAKAGLKTPVPQGTVKMHDAAKRGKDLTVQKLIGMDVYGPEGADLGKISGIVRDRFTHQVTAVIRTGGRADRSPRTISSVVIPAKRLEIEGPQAITDLTRNELRAMPNYYRSLYESIPAGMPVNSLGMSG